VFDNFFLLEILFRCSSFLRVFILEIFKESIFLFISSNAVLEFISIFKSFNSSSENLKDFINDFPKLFFALEVFDLFSSEVIVIWWSNRLV